jgi:tetratricopeptide (TPR) repeat protein
LEFDPKNCEALKGKGKCFQKLNNYLAAVEEYTKAIFIDPEDVSAYTERAYAYYLNKEYEKC